MSSDGVKEYEAGEKSERSRRFQAPQPGEGGFRSRRHRGGRDGSATAHFTSAGTFTGLILASVSAYDLAGNLVQLQEDYFSSATPPRTLNLSYDFANRLVLESVLREGDGTLTGWDYDRANNRTRRTVAQVAAGGATTGVTTTYSYTASGFTPTQFNQLARYTDGTKTVSFTYDRSGNRLTRAVGGQTDTYAYDGENRLTTLTKATTDTGAAGTYRYAYDYRTRRVERAETIGGTTTTTASVFSGGTSAQEYTGTISTTSLAVQFVRGSDWGGGVGGLLYSVRGGTPSFKHYNARGDILAESNATGATTWRAQYDAYGTRAQESGKSGSKGEISPAPTNGQAALDNSVPASKNTRVGVDVENEEVVVLSRQTPAGVNPETYHGHVPKKLPPDAKNAVWADKKLSSEVKVMNDGKPVF